MTLDEYQKKALKFAKPKHENEFFHWVLGLVGESGEIAEKVKKLIRDQESDINRLDKEDMKKEIGDVLWYVATLSNHLGFSLDEVAQANVDKLSSRKQRGVLGGSGDNR